MSDNVDWKELKANIQQERDEIRVKLHLAGMEMKEKWEELEVYWEKLSAKLGKAEDAAEDAAENIGEALSIALNEVKTGYQKIKASLK